MTVSDQAGLETRRPRSITVIGWLYIVAGLFGFAYHVTELNIRRPFEDDVVWVLLVRLLAIMAGVFVLRGANWARWLTLAWLAYHVVLSALHSLSETLMHVVLLTVVAFVLLHPQASTYFRRQLPRSPPSR